MTVIKFFAENWDNALVLALMIWLFAFLYAKKRMDLIGRILFALVTWAEREYGGGTGALKLAAVIEKLYPHIPSIVRVFISTETIERMVDKALQEAKLKWERNPKLIETGQILPAVPDTTGN